MDDVYNTLTYTAENLQGYNFDKQIYEYIQIALIGNSFVKKKNSKTYFLS